MNVAVATLEILSRADRRGQGQIYPGNLGYIYWLSMAVATRRLHVVIHLVAYSWIYLPHNINCNNRRENGGMLIKKCTCIIFWLFLSLTTDNRPHFKKFIFRRSISFGCYKWSFLVISSLLQTVTTNVLVTWLLLLKL